MHVDLRTMWLTLASTDGPLPEQVLAAAVGYALAHPDAQEGPGRRGLRRTLLARSDLPLAAVAALTGWPGITDPKLAAAYLRHPAHQEADLPALLAGQAHYTLRILAETTDRPALLTLLAGQRHPDVAHAAALNPATPPEDRYTAVLRLVEVRDPGAPDACERLTAEQAAALAARTDDLSVLGRLVDAFGLDAAVHARLAALVVTAADALPLGRRTVTGGHPVAWALRALAGAATTQLRDDLASALDTRGVRFTGAPRPATAAQLLAQPSARALGRQRLADREWVEVARHLSTVDTHPAELAGLLAARLGDDGGAWDAFSELAGAWPGTLGELLTAAAGIGAPAAR